MKKYIFWTLFIFVGFASCQMLDNEYINGILVERTTKDSTFRIKEKSPFDLAQIEHFKGLIYFPIDQKYQVDAKLEYIPNGEIIKMKTSTDRAPDYRVYGYVSFELEKKKFKLTVYQNISLQTDSVYKNYLFVPFTDNNSTITTYGGGRYLDFEIPETDVFKLDFNKAYNPYCAYNHRWSCVIPPLENSLDIAINAGEKMYTDIN